MKMTKSEKRKITIVAANFTIGIIIGTVLFYAHMRSQGAPMDSAFNAKFDAEAFFRTAWQDMLWLFSIFLFHSITPVIRVQPILIIRGIVNAFCTFYILANFGVKEAIVVVFPQCFSILLIMALFALSVMERRGLKRGEPFVIRRRDAAAIFILSICASLLEGAIFKIFYGFLF